MEYVILYYITLYIKLYVYIMLYIYIMIFMYIYIYYVYRVCMYTSSLQNPLFFWPFSEQNSLPHEGPFCFFWVARGKKKTCLFQNTPFLFFSKAFGCGKLRVHYRKLRGRHFENHIFLKIHGFLLFFEKMFFDFNQETGLSVPCVYIYIYTWCMMHNQRYIMNDTYEH